MTLTFLKGLKKLKEFSIGYINVNDIEFVQYSKNITDLALHNLSLREITFISS